MPTCVAVVRAKIAPLRPHAVPITMILLASTTVFTWFRGLLVYQWDTIFPLNPPALIQALFWPWSDLISTGVPLPSNSTLPYVGIVYLFHSLAGLSLLDSQIALYFSLFAMAGVSMYFLFINQLQVLHANSVVQFAGVAAALTYVFNPYSMTNVWEIFSLEAFLMATLPLLFLTFQRGLQTSGERVNWKAILALDGLSLFASPAIGNPAFSIPLIMGVIGFYIVWLTHPANSSRRLGSIRFVLTSALSLMMVNIWWIYPTALLAQTQLVRAGGSAYSAVGLVDLIANSNHSSLFNVLRLVGMPALYRSAIYP